MGDTKNAYTILVGKPDGKKPLGRTGRRWENDIGMYLEENRAGRCGLNSSGSG
jgi:hypothetical protein